MDADKEDLVRRLFAELTEYIEDAHELSVQGQAHNRTEIEYVALTNRIIDFLNASKLKAERIYKQFATT